MSLRAEELPTEIWLSIFTLLEGHDLVRAFSGLNTFFDSLLRSPHSQLHIRIKKNESNERLPVSTWSYINRENIYSLSVGRRKGNCLIQFLRWNAQYLTRLSSLSIFLRKSNSYYNIQFLVIALGQLPSLKRLRVKYTSRLDLNADDLQPLMANIFSRRCTVQNYSLPFDISKGQINTSTWSINPCLKSLHFHDISINNLFSSLSFTPELCSLRLQIHPSLVVMHPNITLHHVQKASVCLCSLPFAQLQTLREIMPNVKIFRLDGNLAGNDESYFKENMWNKLFDNVKYFHVNLYDYAYNEPKKTVFKNYIQNLNGKSWFSYHESQGTINIYIKFQSVPTGETFTQK